MFSRGVAYGIVCGILAATYTLAWLPQNAEVSTFMTIAFCASFAISFVAGMLTMLFQQIVDRLEGWLARRRPIPHSEER